MKYKIIENPDYTRKKVGITTVPYNEVLTMFLASLSVEKMPGFISACSHSSSFGVENASLRFFHEMDWEDLAQLAAVGEMKEGNVNIYVYDGKGNDIILEERLFDEIFRGYSVKLMEICKEDETLPPHWADDMKIALTSLSKKGRKQ